MNKREKNIVVLTVIVFIVWSFIQLTKPHPRKKDTNKVNKPVKQIDAGLEQKDKSIPTAQKKEAWDLKAIVAKIELNNQKIEVSSSSDPFEKVILQEPVVDDAPFEFSDLKLAGIIWENEEPMALINDKILRKGETIEGFTIEEIKPAEVVVTRDSQRYVLKLFAKSEEEKGDN